MLPKISLVPRPVPSKSMLFVSPLIAIILTIIAGFFIFLMLDKEPIEALLTIFYYPIVDSYSQSEILVKASPLILIALGLSFGFRAGVWNIGAEGQYIIGALCGGMVALAAYPWEGWWLLPLMILAGVAGGAAWAAIPAYLRTRFNANEILVSLMLTYVAGLLLAAMVSGVLRNPDGFNFPESRLFQDSALLPVIWSGTRVHLGIAIAVVVALIAAFVMRKHVFGFQVRVFGDAPRAAKFAGFKENKMIWQSLLLSGGLAGMAGIFEASSTIGQLVPSIPAGYGFTAIIVAFLGRLNPLGVIFGGLVMAVTYIGGETAQITMGLPHSVTGVFQGMLLFFLLGTDVLVSYSVKVDFGPRSIEGQS